MNTARLVLTLASALAAAACASVDVSQDPEDTDTGADSDSDSDTDVDTDTDADSDTDTGTDEEPSPCTEENAAEECGDPALCVDGFCCDTVCAGGCDACDLAGLEGTCSIRPETAVCREAAGLCDAVELCDGTSAECPADAILTAEDECRPAADDCDLPEYCDGVSVDGCPEDAFVDEGIGCGSADDTVCTDPDTCDGSGVCLANDAEADLACGSSAATECDNPDSCDGSGSCATNPAPMSSPCGSAADPPCDDPDTCDGSGSCDTNLEPAGTGCGSAATSECDAADTCDGAGMCLVNHLDSGHPCGDATETACDDADTCDGAGTCLGNHLGVGAPCGDATVTACDGADSCDSGGTCLANFAPASAECRAAVDACDLPELCDGSGSCPADAFAGAGAACGDGSSAVCTAPDSCDGSGSCLGNHTADGTSCGGAVTEYQCGGAGCAAEPQTRTATQICASGLCAADGAVPWTPLDTCVADEVCLSSSSAAWCDFCDSPPASSCDGDGDAWTYDATGVCAGGACDYSPAEDVCAGGCSTAGGTAYCTSCNDALMAVVGAPLWSWETGDEGWDMNGGWDRANAYARTGSWSMDFYFPANYATSASVRTRWTTSYDFTLCSACTLNVGFWVRGETESGWDGIFLECSPTGAAPWTDLGAEIMGLYSSWTYFTRTVPSSCMSSTMRLALWFESDSSIEYTGYVVDDLRMYTTATVPNGWFDSGSASAAGGWACDGDSWTDEIDVKLHFYKNGTGTPTVRTVHAGGDRPDLVTAGMCGSTPNHGWGFTYDAALLTWLGTGTHTVRAYAVDGPAPCGAGETELSGSPKTFSL